jgi:putative transposase
MADWSVLASGQYLIHDRDGKYCPVCQQMIEAAGVRRIPLPARSPNLNAYAERCVRSVKDEALSRLILFGERFLRYALHEYITHDHTEQPHQVKGNTVLMPLPLHRGEWQGPIRCREWLCGLLKCYSPEAA